MRAVVVLTTAPSRRVAVKIAGSLVRKKLAACVSVGPGFDSQYRWQGKICRLREFQLLIKTTEKRYRLLEAFLKTIHPYEVPEILCLPVRAGSASYLKWIESCLR